MIFYRVQIQVVMYLILLGNYNFNTSAIIINFVNKLLSI
jgi:hypothetical protein